MPDTQFSLTWSILQFLDIVNGCAISRITSFLPDANRRLTIATTTMRFCLSRMLNGLLTHSRSYQTVCNPRSPWRSSLPARRLSRKTPPFKNLPRQLVLSLIRFTATGGLLASTSVSPRNVVYSKRLFLPGIQSMTTCMPTPWTLFPLSTPTPKKCL
jgi:hypothetical protein